MGDKAKPGDTRLLTLLEKGFILFLFVNPFLDFITGFMMNNHVKALPGSVTVSLLVRMAVLLVMAAYVLLRRDWNSLWLIVPIGLSALLSVVSEYAAGKPNISIFADAQYAAKFIFNVASFAVFYQVIARRKPDRQSRLALLEKLFTWVSTWVSSTILITFLLNIHASSYNNILGATGARGFFFSGNEATAILIALFPFVLRNAVSIPLGEPMNARRLLTLLPPALTANALLLVGTKTSFAGLALAVILITVYVAVDTIRRRNASRAFALLTALGLVAIVYLGMSVASSNRFSESISKAANQAEGYLKEQYVPPQEIIDGFNEIDLEAYKSKDTFIGRLLSGRLGALTNTFREWRTGSPLTWLFGLGRGSRVRIVEMDLCEIFLYYGLFGLLAFCWPYVRQLGLTLRAFFRKWDFDGYCTVIALGAVGGYAVLAGHVFFTVTGGFYFALVLLYAAFHYELPAMSLRRLKKEP